MVMEDIKFMLRQSRSRLRHAFIRHVHLLITTGSIVLDGAACVFIGLQRRLALWSVCLPFTHQDETLADMHGPDAPLSLSLLLHWSRMCIPVISGRIRYALSAGHMPETIQPGHGESGAEKKSITSAFARSCALQSHLGHHARIRRRSRAQPSALHTKRPAPLPLTLRLALPQRQPAWLLCSSTSALHAEPSQSQHWNSRCRSSFSKSCTTEGRNGIK